MSENLETKIKIVREGGSKVFEDWHKHFGVTEEDFVDGLRWLDEDPLNEWGRMTRELGCDEKGLVRLTRVHDELGGFVGFYYRKEEYGDMLFLWPGHVSINASDRI